MDIQDNTKKLSNDDLQQVSGGAGEHPVPGKVDPPCPKCGSDDVDSGNSWTDDYGHIYFAMHCNACDNNWVWQYR